MNATQNEILLVDDDSKVLEILGESLIREGFKVNVASTGHQALQSFQRQNPELVILDMMLPDMNGLEVMEHLRESGKNKNVPVLILSSDGDVDSRLSGLNGGAEDYLVKPISLREFNTKVKKTLDRATRTRELSETRNTLESELSRGQKNYTRITKDLKRQLLSIKTLFAVSQDLNRVLDTGELASVVSLTLLGELKISNTAIFSLEKENARVFTLLGVKGFAEEKFAGISIDRDCAFTQSLKDSEKPCKITRTPDRSWLRMLPDLRLAVFEYVTPIRVKGATKGLVFSGPKINAKDYTAYDLDVMMFIANSAGIGMENARLLKQLQQTYVSTLNSLISVIEAKDAYTKGHTERVAAYAVAIANRLRLSEEARRRITFGSLLHDIGKLGVMENVLHKEGKLDADEWELLKSHPEVGAQIVDKMEFLTGTAEIVKHHHESYDGRGYPDGLKGEEIPLGARIVTVADSFDAMTTNRSYRKALSSEQAIRRLQACAGTQFDPRVVRVFVDYLREKGHDMVLVGGPKSSAS